MYCEAWRKSWLKQENKTCCFSFTRDFVLTVIFCLQVSFAKVVVSRTEGNLQTQLSYSNNQLNLCWGTSPLCHCLRYAFFGYLRWFLQYDRHTVKTQTTDSHSQHVQMRMTLCWDKLPYTSVWKTMCISLCVHVKSEGKRWQQEKENFDHTATLYALLLAKGGGHS